MPPKGKPSVVVLAGPNGAGKTTLAPALLRDRFEITQYVNADVIAQGLAGFDPLSAALEAGRVLLSRLHELADSMTPFAFETTLAARSFAPWIKSLQRIGWEFHLLYLWLDTPELAIKRVNARTKCGGHYVPETIVRRRYALSMENFRNLYQPIATTWRVYDNSLSFAPKLVALGSEGIVSDVMDVAKWRRFIGQEK